MKKILILPILLMLLIPFTLATGFSLQYKNGGILENVDDNIPVQIYECKQGVCPTTLLLINLQNGGDTNETNEIGVTSDKLEVIDESGFFLLEAKTYDSYAKVYIKAKPELALNERGNFIISMKPTTTQGEGLIAIGSGISRILQFEIISAPNQSVYNNPSFSDENKILEQKKTIDYLSLIKIPHTKEEIMKQDTSLGSTIKVISVNKWLVITIIALIIIITTIITYIKVKKNPPQKKKEDEGANAGL